MGIIGFMVKKTPPSVLQVYATDGYLAPLSSESTFDTARNSPSSLIADIATGAYAGIRTRTFGGNFWVYRSYLYFDLSALPGGATVTSVTLTVRAFSTFASQVSIQQGTQTGTDNTGLVTGDWNAFTGSYFDFVQWINGFDPRNEFTFNSAGIAYVESVAGSVAKFCLREYDSDYLNVAPLDNTSNSNGMYYSAQAGETNDPAITIEYTI